MKKITSLAFLKRLAKKLKRSTGISHTEALNQIAQQSGYFNWIHAQRALSGIPQPSVPAPETAIVPISFNDWLLRQKGRNSPLGDIARLSIRDTAWPNADSLTTYSEYLLTQDLPYGASRALSGSWKSYQAFLKRKPRPTGESKTITRKKPSLPDRLITYVKSARPVPYPQRTIEHFQPGDPAWISWNGDKAIPVVVTEVDERHYTLQLERPIRSRGSQHFLFLDEVRSTPELACENHVTN